MERGYADAVTAEKTQVNSALSSLLGVRACQCGGS